MVAGLVFISCMKVSPVTGHRARANAEVCAGGTILAERYFWPLSLVLCHLAETPSPFDGTFLYAPGPRTFWGLPFFLAAYVEVFCLENVQFGLCETQVLRDIPGVCLGAPD